MKYLPLVFLLSFIAAKQATAQNLKCYVCKGEEECKNSKAKYCEIETTTAVPSTTIDTSTNTDTSTSTAPSTNTPASSPPVTTASTSETTANTPGAATSTTEIATETPEKTSSTAEITTDTPLTTTNTPEETSSTAETTTNAQEAAAIETDPSLADILIKRKLLKSASAAATLIRDYRSVASRADPVSDKLACYSVNIEGDNGNKTIQRGCINIPNGVEGCKALEEQHPGETTSNCKVCYDDGCNGAATARQISFAALFGILIVKFAM